MVDFIRAVSAHRLTRDADGLFSSGVAKNRALESTSLMERILSEYFSQSLSVVNKRYKGA